MQVYYQENLTFIITGDKVVVRTRIGQQFILEPTAHYWVRRLRLIKVMVSLGEIRNLNELAGWCASGNIAWIHTSAKYEVEKEPQRVYA